MARSNLVWFVPTWTGSIGLALVRPYPFGLIQHGHFGQVESNLIF